MLASSAVSPLLYILLYGNVGTLALRLPAELFCVLSFLQRKHPLYNYIAQAIGLLQA